MSLSKRQYFNIPHPTPILKKTPPPRVSTPRPLKKNKNQCHHTLTNSHHDDKIEIEIKGNKRKERWENKMKIWIINEKEELINIGNAEKIYREKRYIVRVKGKEQVVISESEKEEEAKEKFDIILRGISKIVNSNE